ncbi:MAG: peptidase M28 family protein, partial [Pseudomonadota bacterium]
FDLHHTPDDTFDKIDQNAFNQNVAAYAVFTIFGRPCCVEFQCCFIPLCPPSTD